MNGRGVVELAEGKEIDFSKFFDAIAMIPKGMSGVRFCKSHGLTYELRVPTVHYMPCYTLDGVVLGLYKVEAVGRVSEEGAIYRNLIVRADRVSFLELDVGDTFYFYTPYGNEGEIEYRVVEKYASRFKLGKCEKYSNVFECDVHEVNGATISYSDYRIEVSFSRTMSVNLTSGACLNATGYIDGRAIVYGGATGVMAYLDEDAIMVVENCGDINVFHGPKLVSVEVG